MSESIVKILMGRNGLTREEAENLIEEASNDLLNRLEKGEMPFNICAEWFGLEEDYLDQLM